MTSMRVGLVGCGVISDIYLKTLAKFDVVEVVACASLDLEESRAKAAQYDIPWAGAPDELLRSPDIDCILNLTVPAAHAQVSMAALSAGKHIYTEKPLATDIDDGARILALARRQGLAAGAAPDTFLGGRWQTVRRLLIDGVIGRPTGATAFVGTHGVERHHPNPDFYYKLGGGPMLDLGPYYLTALIALLGPLKRVAGLSRRTFDRRLIESQPRAGEWLDVEVDTHVSGLLEFQSGVIGTITTSFDVWDSETPRLEIYGEDGVICMADPDPLHGPNTFDGPVWFRQRETARWTYNPRRPGNVDWQVAENAHGFNEDSRGLGLVDLAYAVREGRPLRASAEMAQHVVEAAHGLLNSSRTGAFYDLTTACVQPTPLPAGFPGTEQQSVEASA